MSNTSWLDTGLKYVQNLVSGVFSSCYLKTATEGLRREREFFQIKKAWLCSSPQYWDACLCPGLDNYYTKAAVCWLTPYLKKRRFCTYFNPVSSQLVLDISYCWRGEWSTKSLCRFFKSFLYNVFIVFRPLRSLNKQQIGKLNCVF